MDIEILYQTDDFIAVNKPCGVLVHRTAIATIGAEEEYLLQMVRDKIGKHLYPIHRLDRPTSGVVIFALSSKIAAQLSQRFNTSKIRKEYLALVRGWFIDPILSTREVKNEKGTLKEAETEFKPSEQFTLNHPIGNHPTARYSIIKCYPKTGRWHQIRQHLAQLRHYIINDRVHGDNKHNRIFKYELGIEPIFLHAHSVTLTINDGESITITAPTPLHWLQFREIISSQNSIVQKTQEHEN